MALAVTLENGLLPPPPDSAPKDGRLRHVVAQGSSTVAKMFTSKYQNEQNPPLKAFIDVASDTYQKLGSGDKSLFLHYFAMNKPLIRLTKRLYV